MKMKEIGPRGGMHIHGAPSGSANALDPAHNTHKEFGYIKDPCYKEQSAPTHTEQFPWYLFIPCGRYPL